LRRPAFTRVILLVIDSAGIGELPDAGDYGDEGSNTLGNIAAQVGLAVPYLRSLGLGRVVALDERRPGGAPAPTGAFGRMAEASPGKDSVTGHWEMAGVVLDRAFPTFPGGFPPEIIAEFERRIGRGTLGNVVASGTEIIERLGDEHVRTGKPIVYTSADSVFQVAAHEEVIPLFELYKICDTAREILRGKYEVGRVIARPFLGSPGSFERTPNRHDYAVPPPPGMLLDRLEEQGVEVCGIGKIFDIFLGRGIGEYEKTKSNADGMAKTIQAMDSQQSGLIFVNLVDFDQLYGHRNDVEG
jgi:phosphopentomutase